MRDMHAFTTENTEVAEKMRSGPVGVIVLAGAERNLTILLAQSGVFGASSLKVEKTGGDLGGGVIRNAAVLTAGVANPLGREPFEVDLVMLQQVADSINAAGHLPSRLTHPEAQKAPDEGYVDGACWLVGQIKAARVEDNRVVADVHIGTYADASPQGKLGTYLLDLADKAPTDIGLSIRAGGCWYEDSADGGLSKGRVGVVSSVDFVGTAGGNPNGLLAGDAIVRAEKAKQTASHVEALTGESDMYNVTQMQFLQTCGLKQDASETEAGAFAGMLNAAQAAMLDKLGSMYCAGEQPGGQPLKVIPAAKPVAGTVVELSAADQAKIADDAVKADRKRCSDILTLAGAAGIDEKAARGWADRGTTVEQAKELIELAKSHKLVTPGAGSRVEVGSDLNLTTLGPAMADAMLVSSGVPLVQFELNGKPQWEREPETIRDNNGIATATRPGILKTRQPHERTRQFGMSLMGMAKRFLREVGVSGMDDLSDDRIVELALNRNKLAQHQGNAMFLAMGTSDFPNALDTSIRIAIRTTYWQMAVEAIWQRFCAQQVNPDYRAMGLVTMGDIPDLLARAEGEDLRYATVKDGKEKIVVTEFSRGYRFTKQMLKNDIRSVFTTFPQGVVRTARRKENLLPIATLIANPTMSDGQQLFSAAHNNLATGASLGGLGHATSDANGFLRMQACITAMRLQVGMNGDQDGDGGSAAIPLELEARGLIVPAGQEFAARQALTSTVDPTKNNATINPLSGYFKDGVMGLGQLALADGDAWYGYGDPNGMGGGLVLAFLQGEEAPTVASEIDFGTDDLKIKVAHNLGCAPSDYRGLYKNPGK